MRSYPGGSRGVRVLEQVPDDRLPLPPPADSAVCGHHILDAQSLAILVVLVVVHVHLEHIQRLFSIPVLSVGHPAARLHVCLIDAPEGQLLLEQRSAHVRRAVQLPGPVVVEHVGEDTRVPVEEVLVAARVVLDEPWDLLQLVQNRLKVRLGGEQGQTRARQGLQRGPVSFVPRAPDVEDYPLVLVELAHLSE